MKAFASGNPAVLTIAEADAELQRLAILHKNHRDEQYLARRNLRDLPGEIERMERRVSGLETDLATMGQNDGVPSMEAVGHKMGQMPEKVEKSYHTKLGTYRGLECGIIVHPSGGTEIYLDGATRSREQLVRDNPGPRAALNALERLANGYDGSIWHLKAEVALSEGQLRDYEGRVGKEFEHERYASQLADLRDELRMGLSDGASEEARGKVTEVAERIREMRAANEVEAAPERTGARKVVAGRAAGDGED